MTKRILKRMAGILARSVFRKLKARSIPIISVHSKPTVNLVTTWNTRCGISAYSAFLAAELKRSARIRIVGVSKGHVYSPHSFVLGFESGKSHDIVHVQFAYGMFGDLKIGHRRACAFTALLFYLGLALGSSPVVTTFHEVPRAVSAGGRAGLIYTKLLYKLVSQISNIIIVHTIESKELMVITHGAEESKIRVVPMGCIEAPLFLTKDKCKERLNLSGKKVIAIPGFVSRHKGHDLVMSVLSLLDKSVHLLIAGGTWAKKDVAYYEELKGLTQSYDCCDRVMFNDDFPISSDIMNATDIAILPYRRATDSMMLRDLVAYNVPTITSDLIAFKECKEDYDCIELFRRNDRKDLLTKISSLLYDDKKQTFLREQCRKMWNARRWSRIAAKHAEIYLEVLSGHPDTIYDDKKQRERINWLRDNTSGISLEIGCAGGFVTSYVGADVGLDVNGCRIRFAKTNRPEKDFITASALCLPFKEKAFDTLLIPEILEHVPIVQAEIILSEAKRVGRKILITLPNADKLNYDKSLVENPEHMWFPTRELVLNLLKTRNIQYTSENDFILVYLT